jgi:hypothetical protein
MDERDISAAAFLPASKISYTVFSEILPKTLHYAKLLIGYSILELK